MTDERRAMLEALKPGDKIRLNENAREWTRGKVFTVEVVPGFGVLCFEAVGNAHAFYRAAWHEIEEALE
jgi:hypothetical protein